MVKVFRINKIFFIRKVLGSYKIFLGLTHWIPYYHSHSNLNVNARGTTLYLEILGINKAYFYYHTVGLTRIS